MTIGVDVGGTNIRAGIKIHGDIRDRQHTQLQKLHSLDHTLGQLIDTIRPLVQAPVTGIGVAVPSVVDTKNGIVYNVVNIPSWERVALKEILENAFHLPVSIDNDANCFVLGEHLFGEAQDFSNIVGVAIGTGIGVGIVIDGKVYAGNNAGAGEIGYLPYRDHNLEYYCSSTFFSELHQTTALEVYESALQHQPHALKLWETFGYHLGHAIKAVVYTYDPEIIVFGGSLAKAFTFFEGAMLDTLHKDFHFPHSLRQLKFAKSMNDNITLLGAAALAE